MLLEASPKCPTYLHILQPLQICQNAKINLPWMHGYKLDGVGPVDNRPYTD